MGLPGVSALGAASMSKLLAGRLHTSAVVGTCIHMLTLCPDLGFVAIRLAPIRDRTPIWHLTRISRGPHGLVHAGGVLVTKSLFRSATSQSVG